MDFAANKREKRIFRDDDTEMAIQYCITQTNIDKTQQAERDRETSDMNEMRKKNAKG